VPQPAALLSSGTGACGGLRSLLFLSDTTQEILRFSIQNTGRATAKYVGFMATLENIEITRVENLNNVSHLNEGRTMVSYSDDSHVIHPNGISHLAGEVQFRRRNPAENIVLSITSYCENAVLQKDTATMAPLSQPANVAPTALASPAD
jgi:hypothetical protein